MQQRIDCALGQQRAQAERHAGRGQHLLDRQAHAPRHAAAAEIGVEGHAVPAGAHELLVRLAEAVGVGDDALIEAQPLLVAGHVQRRHLGGHEAARLIQQCPRSLQIGVRELIVSGQAVEIGDVLKHEQHVVNRSRVLRHHNLA